MLLDRHQRRISYLRLSVTDRCNLRCRYCMPAEGLPLFDRAEMLTPDEMLTIARTAVGLGIRKIRVTGGEPLIRSDILTLLAQMGALPNLERLVLTTNGLRLERLARGLVRCGVSGVNISIDSLQPERYGQITRGGNLDRCLAGIAAALEAGLRTKLNVVLMNGVNDDEILDFVELARTRPVAVRFIEYMPTRNRRAERHLTLPTEDLLARLARAHTLRDADAGDDLALAGPARNFRLEGFVGTVGVISPVSCHFCSDCNRIRVTATGLARGCLFHEDGLDLKPWLRDGDELGLARALLRVIQDKPQGHDLDGQDGPDQVPMSRLGG
ncbi:GTP 3',8-cyclase MoaA [bacterium DOLZORAL124_64_63]|nr:MAG: GTP 3',8-cyclase MoaA [bacterium DOLZORAL124_64_63]